MLFATCSFQEFRPEMGIPVRSSRGYPRFRLRYPLVHAMPATFPEARWLRGVDKPTFDELYHAKIRAVGVDALRREADRIRHEEAQALGDDRALEKPIVLLCFERWNQKKDPGWCHRHSFQAAWSDLAGEDVPELGALPRRELAADDDPTLF